MCCLSVSDKNKGSERMSGSMPGPLVGGHCSAKARAGEQGAGSLATVCGWKIIEKLSMEIFYIWYILISQILMNHINSNSYKLAHTFILSLSLKVIALVFSSRVV